MAKQSKKTIILAIRDFALPVPRTGSIEVNSGYGQIFNAAGAQAARGRDIHLAVQKARQKEFAVYKSEVKLAEKFESDNFIFSVSGRMDGFVDGLQPMVEEIKSSNQALELAELLRQDAQHPYCLQLATYAYILYKERQVVPRCHFVITDAKGEIVDEFDYAFSLDAYEKWLALRILDLDKECLAEENRRLRRQSVAQLLNFPFKQPRPFQQDLVANLTADLKESANIIVQAPTGLGKTIGAMYPTLIDSLEKGERFIYVTPKNSQHAVAEDAVQRLTQTIEAVEPDKLTLYSTTLNAKAKMCLKEEVICNPTYCQYARDYYTKVDKAQLVDKLSLIPHLGAEQFKAIGLEHEVCPFELSLDTVQNADVVIGDYNYVFSPRNILGRLTFSLAKNNQKPNLVIDEAHNLPGRATDYYSRSLSSRDLVELGSALTDLGFDIAVEGKKIVSNILFTISTVGRTYNQKDCKVTLSPLLFESHLADLQALAGRYVEGKRDKVEVKGKADGKTKRDALLTLLNLISDFTEALGYEGDEFLHLYVRNKLQDGGIEESLKVVCCDASAKLKIAHKEFAHVVAFSATIKPFDYFSQLSGLHEDDLRTREYLSPFPKAHRKLLIIPQVSTKFSDRAKNYGKIAEAISRIVAVRPGQLFCLFPQLWISLLGLRQSQNARA